MRTPTIEGASLTQLPVDARMATALTLLRATAQPVSSIALSFAPTAVRGHEPGAS